jgi:hypothetical protein
MSSEEPDKMKSVPYPLQPVILTGDHLGSQMKSLSSQLSGLRAPSEEEVVLRDLAHLGFDAILTTNYTYELEKALDEQFKCMPSQKCKARKKFVENAGKYNTQQLHTCFAIEDYPPVWHIHGEASRYETMVLGHYYYGKLLAKMQQYMSGFLARYKIAIKKQQEIEFKSWIDYFMLGKVYIVGLGMALSEFDLWWLINCKKRHFPGTKVVLYKPDVTDGERMLAEAYNVEVVTDGKGKNDDFAGYYHWLYNHLREQMGEEVKEFAVHNQR